MERMNLLDVLILDVFPHILPAILFKRLARKCNTHNDICSGFEVVFLFIEFDTLYHPSLRQDVFVKEEYHYLNVP